jgi:metal-sulfur cluster biosynthetic enzyme
MSEHPPPPEPTPAAPADAAPVWTSEAVLAVLRHVVDPELHINIVDLGLVYGASVAGDKVDVKMTLTSPGCPYGPYLLHQVKDTVLSLKGIKDANIEVVWDPPWGPDKMTEEVRLELGFDV